MESTADSSASASLPGDPNDIPTISPHHASSMMMQAMARKVQQDQIAANVDPALYAMMQGEAEQNLERSDSKSITPPSYVTNNLPLLAGFGGGPIQNSSDGTAGGGRGCAKGAGGPVAEAGDGNAPEG